MSERLVKIVRPHSCDMNLPSGWDTLWWLNGEHRWLDTNAQNRGTTTRWAAAVCLKPHCRGLAYVRASALDQYATTLIRNEEATRELHHRR
jgi:hypothetical protein